VFDRVKGAARERDHQRVVATGDREEILGEAGQQVGFLGGAQDSRTTSSPRPGSRRREVETRPSFHRLLRAPTPGEGGKRLPRCRKSILRSVSSRDRSRETLHAGIGNTPPAVGPTFRRKFPPLT